MYPDVSANFFEPFALLLVDVDYRRPRPASFVLGRRWPLKHLRSLNVRNVYWTHLEGEDARLRRHRETVWPK